MKAVYMLNTNSQQVYGALPNHCTLHTSQNFYTDILSSDNSLSLLFSSLIDYEMNT